jgi:hypothetical protein
MKLQKLLELDLFLVFLLNLGSEITHDIGIVITGVMELKICSKIVTGHWFL